MDIFDRITSERTTEDMIAIEGGGLKAPGEYTGSWWKDVLPSLLDPGVQMDPANIGAVVGAKAIQPRLPSAATLAQPLRGESGAIRTGSPADMGDTPYELTAKGVREARQKLPSDLQVGEKTPATAAME